MQKDCMYIIFVSLWKKQSSYLENIVKHVPEKERLQHPHNTIPHVYTARHIVGSTALRFFSIFSSKVTTAQTMVNSFHDIHTKRAHIVYILIHILCKGSIYDLCIAITLSTYLEERNYGHKAWLYLMVVHAISNGWSCLAHRFESQKDLARSS